MNENIYRNLETLILDQQVIHIVFSNILTKSLDSPSKVEIRPLLIRGETKYQVSKSIGNKMFHRNLASEECFHLVKELTMAYKQGVIFSEDHDYYIFNNKKNVLKILTKPPTKQLKVTKQNRVKNYILDESMHLPFLIELGVMDQHGKVLASKSHKFRQINRFLEMVDDATKNLDASRQLKIIDFGCGKGYLTFGLYYFLRYVKKLNVSVLGLDLKSDVMEFCSHTAQKLGFEHLQFMVGSIESYSSEDKVDMVVALHACDVATDAALEKACLWGAEVILAAPCCQHELYAQIQCQALAGLLQHGILKERMAALLTDTLRAQALEAVGYKTDVIEFIDSEHTPKNLLIRAIKGNSKAKQQHALASYHQMKQMFHVTPSIESVIRDNKNISWK